jgi:imidazolonepropionase-like amidohydrolase
MQSFRIGSLLASALAFVCGVAQAETTIVSAARMLDVDSGKLVSPAVLVVEDGRIAAVNPEAPPAGAARIDLGDATLLPGFIDMHTHLTGDLEEGWVHRPVEETAADAALRGAHGAKLTLAAGFTTVREAGSRDFTDVALSKAIAAGRIEGPDIFPVGHALSITGGHCDDTGFAPGVLENGPERGVADGADAAVKAVRYQIKHGAKVIKMCATAGVLSFEGPVGAQQFSEAEMRAIVEEAGRHGLKVMAHAHGSDGILAAVKAGVASIDHGSMLTDEIIREMKKRGTWLVPTTYLADSLNLDNLPPPIRKKAEYVLPLAKESIRKAIAAGVRIAFGTDAAVIAHGTNAREFGALVDRGMTPLQAIRSATVDAAELLGVEDRGRLAAGLRADIVAVPGNPLEDIHVTERVSFVMKQGTVYKLKVEGGR